MIRVLWALVRAQAREAAGEDEGASAIEYVVLALGGLLIAGLIYLAVRAAVETRTAQIT
ncbi:hypothetical protein [Actinoplanes sp. G11-F43]|uniref:hypothetical protein n=1 Tax=Actinoplanes sp. G11-F43 TaxID=3424130 RepID=UPI003D3339D2